MWVLTVASLSVAALSPSSSRARRLSLIDAPVQSGGRTGLSDQLEAIALGPRLRVERCPR
jgi:hypothetical protein